MAGSGLDVLMMAAAIVSSQPANDGARVTATATARATIRNPVTLRTIGGRAEIAAEVTAQPTLRRPCKARPDRCTTIVYDLP